MLNRTLCWGHTPRFWRMLLSSVRMSFPMMYAVPEVGGNRPVRIDLSGRGHSKPANQKLVRAALLNFRIYD